MGCENSRMAKSDGSAFRHTDIMEFLIVLKDKDFEKSYTCPSYYDKVNKNGSNLPGILECEKLNTIQESKYIIRDIALPRTVYIKLPKEKLFVASDIWEYEYMKSQIQELILIFGLLVFVFVKNYIKSIINNLLKNQEKKDD